MIGGRRSEENEKKHLLILQGWVGIGERSKDTYVDMLQHETNVLRKEYSANTVLVVRLLWRGQEGVQWIGTSWRSLMRDLRVRDSGTEGEEVGWG